MALPRINHPVIHIDVPSTGKARKFRPFLTRDEKVLLMAKESGKMHDIMSAVLQIVESCSLDPINVSQLTTYDVEYVFLKLRSTSVNNIVKAAYKDNEDEEVREFDIDLDKISVTFPDGSKEDKKVIEIAKGMFLKLRHPRATLFGDPAFYGESGDDAGLMRIISECIETVTSGEEVYKFDEETVEEKNEFVNNLDVKTLAKIQEFISAQPHLYHEIKYKNKAGNERKIELSSIHDFFIF